ncbi:MAG: molybdopterin molybdotransferase MoeA [Bacteroidales bacterium]|nr:molybdopterin molybdotransferase MoeA [Bacteroidales bacterium]
MILFEEALDIINKSAVPLASEKIRLEDCLDRTLSQDVFSDMDMPPFDKSAVDGYACRRADLGKELKVLETIPAGKIPTKLVEAGCCSKLMTGGMLPDGADTVIMVEDVEVTGTDTIRFVASRTAPNFCTKAEDITKGEKVLTKGTQIRPQHIAILASVGCANPEVYKQPRIGIISTGDELVEPAETPALSQIRNSNAYQLLAQAKRANCKANYYGIARDTEEATLEIIQQAAAESDIVILTGGISAGDFDFVPAVIQQAGFDIKFRSMAVQPGKPVIFATRGNQYLVALPGNPVSSFVQFELLVKHLITLITGNNSPDIQLKVPMGIDYTRKRTTRKAFFPVYFSAEGTVMPVEYHGSAHIHSYIHAHGIVTIEIGESEIKKGTPVDVRLV